ncbi:hypothetical protein DESUT3_26510 [Desulfuromonas versatilis]|uniref:SprA-related family protein n=1 Tax=Desulfuromonas versatilis TaxID=2802975 RepID=A0ABN6DZK3_9BACT|nr:putative metalloprotease CJM1_0395 family protein [Desulfuromonas versatilis]BCR05582.1 hypothetical protein DESUT3_26510 [Desulfuromonas versatilis]
MATEPTTSSLSETYLSLEQPALRNARAEALPTTDSRRVPNPSPAAEGKDSVVLSEKARVLSELTARDREVRAHEAAHAAVGGQYAGAPSYTYQSGPDGRRYAIGGEVQIDTSPVPGDPQATLEKSRVIRAAALAPAQPSSADRAIAARAAAMAVQARSELAAEAEGSSSAADRSAPADQPTNAPQPTAAATDSLPGRILDIRA